MERSITVVTQNVAVELVSTTGDTWDVQAVHTRGADRQNRRSLEGCTFTPGDAPELWGTTFARGIQRTLNKALRHAR